MVISATKFISSPEGQNATPTPAFLIMQRKIVVPVINSHAIADINFVVRQDMLHGVGLAHIMFAKRARVI